MARNDHFSGFARTYAAYRPTYPDSLFAKLARLAPAQAHAWDCATGTGQAAVSLADHFRMVTATDVGAAMIDHAKPHPRVNYAVGSAEKPDIKTASIDLITVAMALHWFDRETFWHTCQRVLCPDGVLAYWGYGLPEIDPAIDAIVQHYHDEKVGRFWPTDRAPLMNMYAEVHPPAQRIAEEDHVMTTEWELENLVGMLDSWSATHRAREETKHDPIPAVAALLNVIWGDRKTKRTVRWPLKLHAFRFNSSA
ncbi:MAG: class I SAM-dependent methyltransferase [Synoicihabitans sp.]